MTNRIKVDRPEPTCMVISIDRPDKKNALTHAMYTAITEALGDAAEEPAVRAAVITGTNGCFTAGNDLGNFLEKPPVDHDSPVFRFLQTIATFPKPLIAAVDGVAVGVGTTLLFHCDLVYTTANAVFQLPFVSLGLTPEAAVSFLLPRLVGYQRAAEILLTADPFDADTASTMGLINQIVPADQLMKTALKKARKIASLPPVSIQQTKRLMKQRLHPVVMETLLNEAEVFVRRLKSPEAQEAFSAFLEKRAPDFSKF